MNRKKIAIVAYWVIIISINIIIWSRIITKMLTPEVLTPEVLTPYEYMLATTPDSITCTTQIVDNVVLLNEYVELCSEDYEKSGKCIGGVASFETEGKIYMFGHGIPEEDTNYDVYKVDKFGDTIYTTNLMGYVISNEDDGVIAQEIFKIGEHSTIPVAKTAQLGEAFILSRNDEGNICEYPITIEGFKENQNSFFYSSSEVQLGDGWSGSLIIQNNELIGVHYGCTFENGNGMGRIIWNLEIMQP